MAEGHFIWAEGPQPAKRACLPIPQGLEVGAASTPHFSDNPDDSGHNGWTDQFEDQEEPRPGFHNDRVSEFSMPLDWSQLAEWLPIGRRWFMCFGDFS